MAENSGQLTRSILEYDIETSVPSSTQVSLIVYTNNTSRDLILDQILATGQVDAQFEIYFNSTKKIEYITSEQNRMMNISFPNGVLLKTSDTIEIKVEHFETSIASDFFATLIMHGASL